MQRARKHLTSLKIAVWPNLQVSRPSAKFYFDSIQWAPINLGSDESALPAWRRPMAGALTHTLVRNARLNTPHLDQVVQANASPRWSKLAKLNSVLLADAKQSQGRSCNKNSTSTLFFFIVLYQFRDVCGLAAATPRVRGRLLAQSEKCNHNTERTRSRSRVQAPSPAQLKLQQWLIYTVYVLGD